MLTRTRERLASRQPVNLVIYGDSICEVGRTPGYFGGASCKEMNWGSQLGALLNAAFPGQEFRVAHFGIGGQNTYEGLGRRDWLAGFDPHLVLVSFGANDCGWHYLIPEETDTALRSLVDGIAPCFNADAVVICPGGDNPLQPLWVHLDETIAVLRQVAADLNVPFVDMHTAILTATENGTRWTDFHNGIQDCHPNDRGHGVWAQAAFAVLRPLLAA